MAKGQIQIDIIGYLQRNLKHPKQLDLTDEIINYIAKMDTELTELKQRVDKLQKENDGLIAQVATGNSMGAIANTYTVVKFDELCRLQKAADELATLKGHKGVFNA